MDENSEPIVFGNYRGLLYRRDDVKNSSWFFRVFLKAEDRYYRKSLGTTDIREARELAAKELISVLAKVESGQRIVATSVGDLKAKFDLHRKKLVDQGQTALATFKNHGTRLNHGMMFLASIGKGDEARVNALDGKLWEGYFDWRFNYAREKGKTIRRDVIRDELLTIRGMFTFARDEKICLEKTVPVWDFAVEKEGPKRERMTSKNYTDYLNTIQIWQRKPPPLHDKDAYLRNMLRHVVLVVSNSGLRSGEVFGLRNRDVEIRASSKECILNIRASTSKVRRDRQIYLHSSWGGRTGKGKDINYLIRWMTDEALHRKPDDYVFARFEGGRKTGQTEFYDWYKKLRKLLEPKSLEWFDLYHCRHFWITNRLYAGEPIHLVAKAAGTSVKEIESTYSHVLTEMATKAFSKRVVEYDDEGGYRVVENVKKKG